MDPWIRGLTRLERRVVRDLESLYPDVSQIIERAVKESQLSPDPSFAIVARFRQISDGVSAAFRWSAKYDEAISAIGLTALAFGLREGAKRVTRDVPEEQSLLAAARIKDRSDTRNWLSLTAEQSGRRAANAATRDVLAGTSLAVGAVAATMTARSQVLARNFVADAARDGLLLAYGDVDWVWRTEPGACEICDPLEGEVYPAGSDFEAAHVNCRCYPEPA